MAEVTTPITPPPAAPCNACSNHRPRFWETLTIVPRTESDVTEKWPNGSFASARLA